MNVKDIYKCEICGKVIEIEKGGAPDTICCGQPMKLMEPKTAEWSSEKHVPKITINGDEVTVDVGISMGTPHPMTSEHWIMWIELIEKNGTSHRKYLNPGDEPKAIFYIKDAEGAWAREYCNVHGLWKGTQ